VKGEGGRGDATSRVSSHPLPLTLSRHWLSLPHAALFLLCGLPAGLMVFDFLTGHLAAEPIKDLTHRTGIWGITAITATPAITPLRRLTGWNRLQSYRRILGLVGFFYVVLHFLAYLGLDQFFDWHTIVKDITRRPLSAT
jgi:sulfoxide reductase heme-binding subunit YedZ